MNKQITLNGYEQISEFVLGCIKTLAEEYDKGYGPYQENEYEGKAFYHFAIYTLIKDIEEQDKLIEESNGD